MANAVSKAKAYETYAEIKKVLNEKGVQAALAVLDSKVNNHIDKTDDRQQDVCGHHEGGLR